MADWGLPPGRRKDKENLMRLVLKPFVVTGIAALTVCALASVAAAQSTVDRRQQVPTSTSDQSGVDAAAAQANLVANPIPSEFGTSSISILQIPAVAFRARKRAATLDIDTSEGTIFPGEATSNWFDYWAPVDLPAGVLISWMDLYACDSNATNHVTVVLTGYYGPAFGGSAAPGVNDFFAVSSTQVAAAPNCGYWAHFVTPALQINNDVRYNGGYHYALNLEMTAGNSTNRLKGVDLWYMRQVSPAPATASFADVPTGHQYFQFIEALKASGITGGCGTGVNYCPGDPVTRGQMAVFLARALGLHWPY
jgi:S-layer homology domain